MLARLRSLDARQFVVDETQQCELRVSIGVPLSVTASRKFFTEAMSITHADAVRMYRLTVAALPWRRATCTNKLTVGGYC